MTAREEAVRAMLSQCAAESNRDATRTNVLNFLSTSNEAANVESMKMILAELAVMVIHSSTNSTVKSAPRVAEAARQSLVGTVSLPRAALEGKRPKGDEKGSSGSDVPSESGVSSSDDTNRDSYAEELWKSALKDGKVKATQQTTHKDFFDSLIKDIEEREDFHSAQREPHPEEKLALVEHLQSQVEEAIARVLAQAEYRQFVARAAAPEAEAEAEDEDLMLTGELLDEICEEVALVVDPEGLRDGPDGLKDQLSEALSFLYGQAVSPETRELLLQAVELEVHAVVSGAESLTEGESDDDGEEVEEEDAVAGASAASVADEADVRSNNRHDHELAALNDRELELKDKSGRAYGSPGHALSHSQAMVYDDSSSSSSERLPAETEPVTTHRTPAKLPRTPVPATSQKKRGPDPTEGVPAWELPKSPLDPLFRKGYGGLGQSDLREVMDLLTPNRRARAQLAAEQAAGEEEDADVMAMAGHESDASSQGQQSDDEDEDNEFIGVDDLPVPPRAQPSQLDQRLQRYLVENEETFHVDLRGARAPVPAHHSKAPPKPPVPVPVPVPVPAPVHTQTAPSKLSKKKDNGAKLRAQSGPGANAILLEEDVLPHPSDFHEAGPGSAPRTKSSTLNAMIQRSFQAHLDEFSPSALKKEKRRGRGASDGVVYSPADKKCYRFDEVQPQDSGDDAASMNTEEYHAQSTSPHKAHGKGTESAVAAGKKLKKKAAAAPSALKKRRSDPGLLGKSAPSAPVAPKLAKSAEPTSATKVAKKKSPSRPSSASKVRTSTDSRLLVPTANSRQRSHTPTSAHLAARK